MGFCYGPCYILVGSLLWATIYDQIGHIVDLECFGCHGSNYVVMGEDSPEGPST